MGKHVVHFYGPLSPMSFQGFRDVMLEAFAQRAATEITILLSSEGGDINSGFTAYNFIREFPIPVTCINMGTVESMAIMMFLAADTRCAVEHSRFLLHSFHWGFNAGQVDRARLAEHSESLSFDVERYATIFEQRTNSVQAGFDIRKCLDGAFKILDTNKAVDIGMLTVPTAAGGAEMKLIGRDDIHWWPRTVF